MMLTTSESDASALPPAFDLPAYRAHNPGLAHMDDEALAFHYQAHGRAEGRRCSEVHDRESFLQLLPSAAKILEIGPSWSPVFRRPAYDVAYLDVYDTEELRRQAEEAPGGGGEAPRIDHVWRGERYRDLIGADFDIVFAARSLEYQPNLVGHLRDVAAVLRPSGMAALVLRDQRFGADHFLPESDITFVLDAHVQDRTRHAVSDVIAHDMMQAHQQAMRHWVGDHGDDPRYAAPSEQRTQCLLRAMAYQDAGDAYVEARAWRFTPDSFAAVLTELHALKMIPLRLARVYPTVFGAGEFYALLQRR